jgi:hypothetical protein
MTDHVIIIAETGTFKCLACEAEYTPTYPVPITMLGAMIEAFQKSHEVCVALGEDDDV